MADEYELDIAYVAIRLFICIAGLLGNLLVILVILILQEYKKTVTHWYVLQLAIADSIFLLTLPFKVSENIQNEWIYPGWMCKAKETILFLNYYASICFLVIMSVDRYVAVCHATSDWLQKFRSHCYAYAITGVTWVICLAICVPIMLYSDKRGTEPNCRCSYKFPTDRAVLDVEYCMGHGFTKNTKIFNDCLNTISNETIEACEKAEDNSAFTDYESDINSLLTNGVNIMLTNTNSTTSTNRNSKTSSCSYRQQGNGWRGFLIFNFTLMFLVPLCIMVFCYSMIVLKIRTTKVRPLRSRSLESTSSTQASNHVITQHKRTKSIAKTHANAEKNRVVIMCAVLVILFVSSWLPFHVIHLAKIRGINVNARVCKLLPTVAAMIAYLNSALNPYLYNFLGTKFGRRLRDASMNVKHTVRRKTSAVVNIRNQTLKSRSNYSQHDTTNKMNPRSATHNDSKEVGFAVEKM